MSRPHVVILGSGFGGLFLAKSLRKEDVDITLIAMTPQHLFQPLLYQVATGILSEGEVAPATREILSSQKNVTVLQGLVEDIDTETKTVVWRNHNDYHRTPYDILAVATGVGQSYFGNGQFASFAPGLKTIDDALELRARIFNAFELAEIETDPSRIEQLLTFVVVGAGPTGVEMAGQIRELSSHTLKGEFRTIDPTKARVILVDGAPLPLPSFGEKLGNRTKKALTKLGVEFRGNTLVTNVDGDSVTIKNVNGDLETIPTSCKVWAAGVQASELGQVLAQQTGVELDRAGRVKVNPDLTVSRHKDIFVIGDLMSMEGVPGVAQGAIQSARFVGKKIKQQLRGQPSKDEAFRYFDKGSMATIARFKAVVSMGKLQFDGFTAWLAWCFLHLLYITGFKARVSTLIHWMVSFLSRARPERAATNQQMVARLALEHLGKGASGRLVAGEDPQG
ncbi:NAD(P)/FAD-dependent oxidoreductase [Actinomycetaceae bacterium WB03_NA08]|uniref:NADH:ubiquinone reductase (non-electrogenic) n=1 Tax=Scrofimicrobium canadense TaxID=2652290 RepID=A0A6N7VP74_9ACTO|nr:NAD(P)/FAD-dependent oxidoreductase [Scrofimicrobium canadense]MSS83529.1 NAD(P)/FAD-dependent oxidoreductase [Scrofimicrobium canadense]